MLAFRTLVYRTALALFGKARDFQSKLSSDDQLKKWHGPAWRRTMGLLLGSSPKIARYQDDLVLFVRPDQINDMLSLCGEFEEKFLDDLLYALKPGDVFVDCGAYIGRCTVIAAPRVGDTGKVIAVEADAQNFSFLARNVIANKFENVSTIPIAVGSKDGAMPFYEAGKDRSISTTSPDWTNFLYPDSTINLRHKSVFVKKLSTILKEQDCEHVDFLKLDVEGAEISVLDGSRDLFEKGIIKKILVEEHGTMPTLEKFFSDLPYAVTKMGEYHLLAEYIA